MNVPYLSGALVTFTKEDGDAPRSFEEIGFGEKFQTDDLDVLGVVVSFAGYASVEI